LIEKARRQAPERRQSILEAARFLALRHGLRAVTMEAIAREAHVAKPTLYGYFPDKAAVYEAVMEELVVQFRAAFDTALAQPGDVVERVAGALADKHKTIVRVLEGSPHADELYDEHSRLAAEQFRRLEAHVEAELERALQGAGVARPRPLAQLVLAATYGVGRKARNVAEIGPAIRLVTERLVRPELA